MGCDIHLRVEKNNGEAWVSCDIWETDEDGNERVNYKNSYYSDRNYETFAILADVRNSRDIVPIMQPRGLPENVSERVRKESYRWGADGHSHSWLTLSEILDYDWTQVISMQGWVNFKTWADWIRYERGDGECPEMYSGSVGGGSVKKIEAEEMDSLATEFNKLSWQDPQRDSILLQNQSVYALAKWGQPLYKTSRLLLSDLIPRLLKIAGGISGADNVRIVFWFDN